MGFWWGPNNSTRQAVNHPRRSAVTLGVAAAAIAAAGGIASGPWSAALAAVISFVIVAGLTLFLWRPGGPGARWAERRGVRADPATTRTLG